MALVVVIGVILAARFGIMEVSHTVNDMVKKRTEVPAVTRPAAPEPTPSPPSEPEEPFIGSTILEGYGSPEAIPQEDLIRLGHAINNFALLVKGDTPLPLGSNEELSAALRGKNRLQMRFLPDKHPAFNEQGQLVDRWGTPLFFHAESQDRLDIRSAGPDKTMWTNDDLHRKHDGRFLRGDDLNPPSLMGAGAYPKKR